MTKVRLVSYCNYYFRQLLLIELEDTNTNKLRYALFYKSAGITTPDKCSEGSIRPILGIVDPNYPKMFNLIKHLIPAAPDGWIAKGGSKSNDDPASYFGSSELKKISRILENVDLTLFEKSTYDEFCRTVEPLYDKSNFCPKALQLDIDSRRKSK